MKRFFDKVAPDPSRCHIWTGARDRGGYGSLGFRGRIVGAHRVAWILENGEIPGGVEICHTCDVRSCVNPAHLFLGTRADNVRDAVAKGRWDRTGSRTSGLTDADVLEIRRLAAEGVPRKELQARYGLSKTYVGQIVRGELWKHLLPRRGPSAPAG